MTSISPRYHWVLDRSEALPAGRAVEHLPGGEAVATTAPDPISWQPRGCCSPHIVRCPGPRQRPRLTSPPAGRGSVTVQHGPVEQDVRLWQRPGRLVRLVL